MIIIINNNNNNMFEQHVGCECAQVQTRHVKPSIYINRPVLRPPTLTTHGDVLKQKTVKILEAVYSSRLYPCDPKKRWNRLSHEKYPYPIPSKWLVKYVPPCCFTIISNKPGSMTHPFWIITQQWHFSGHHVVGKFDSKLQLAPHGIILLGNMNTLHRSVALEL